MAEITAIADVVTVLKDGVLQGTVPASTPMEKMVQMMVGRELAASAFSTNATDEVVLDVQELSGKGFTDISFTVHAGEILGFAGLTGSGRTALSKAIFGEAPYRSGQMRIKGKPFHPRHPGDAIASHIAYLPDDRKSEGLFLEMSVTDNIASVHLHNTIYNNRANKDTAHAYIRQLHIRTPGAAMPVRKLSGGNQQKTVLAKWLSADPELLVVNEPTHGVDVGAKTEIYRILKNLTAKGKGIIMISSELPELLLLADRIVVMYQGKLMQILPKQEATEEKLAALASGIQ
ncbi:MAG TPA: ATP-binding cassette domain-containing protein [Agriterribacter sp.]|nr:ATP-binding cassette domain-containing protein [Agriterribacter sp.]